MTDRNWLSCKLQFPDYCLVVLGEVVLVELQVEAVVDLPVAVVEAAAAEMLNPVPTALE
jgi:hypothetical protein